MEKTVLLVGVPNCGKSALFCRLTGGHARVGNFAGVTVERREGRLRGGDVRVSDTPGICSLIPTRAEEAVTCDAIRERPALIVQVIDGAAPLRSFHLARELCEQGLPLLFAVSRADLYRARGRAPDTAAVAAALGAPVIAVSSHDGTGVDTLRRAILSAVGETANGEEKIKTDDGVTPGKPGATVTARKNGNVAPPGHDRLPRRAAGTVGDERRRAEAKGALHRSAAVPDAERLTRLLLAGATFERGHRLDRLLTGRRLGYLFAGVTVALLLALTSGAFSLSGAVFDRLGGYLTGLCARWLARVGTPGFLTGFLADGCLGSLLSALSFFPPLFLYYAATAALDDCGYLSRMTFLFDRACARVGLGGGVVMPCLLSLGCGVTGIGACRTLSGREKRGCAGFCTYFPCHAKLPLICAVVRAAGLGAMGYIALFLFPCLVGVVAVALAGRSGGEYLEELPPLTRPSATVVGRTALWRGAAFLRRAGGVIALSGALFWLLAHVGAGFRPVTAEDSLLADVGRWLLPVFAPLGIRTWGAVAATLAGFIAKENSAVVLETLGGAGLLGAPANAVAYCLFGLLSPPCVAAAAEMRRVIGRRAYLYLLAQLAVAFGVCAVFRLFTAWLACL